jgi:hypothetical protein
MQLSACDVLSANSNVSGWQVQNKKTQQLNDLHAIVNDIESLRRSFILKDLEEPPIGRTFEWS